MSRRGCRPWRSDPACRSSAPTVVGSSSGRDYRNGWLCRWPATRRWSVFDRYTSLSETDFADAVRRPNAGTILMVNVKAGCSEVDSRHRRWKRVDQPILRINCGSVGSRAKEMNVSPLLTRRRLQCPGSTFRMRYGTQQSGGCALADPSACCGSTAVSMLQLGTSLSRVASNSDHDPAKVGPTRTDALTAPLRHVAGGEPVARLNARLKDASES